MAAFKLTKKQVKEEIKKCGRDPVYFIKHYCRIQHPQKGLIPFHLYDFQEDLLQEFNDYRFNIILKARQLGISTLTAGYIVWMMLFRREKNVLVVATKFKTAANLVKKVKKMFKHVPAWLRIAEIEVNNETAFTLTNGSQIQASTTSADAGRSEALSLLVIDEAAHVDGLDEMWMAIGPTLATGGRCIALSTPNGVGNWFHRNYVDAVDMKNQFHPVELMWSVHPDRDQKWFEEEKRKYTAREIAQEYECLTSGTNIVTRDGIRKIEDIKIGEYVLTHRGRFRKVVKTMEKIVSSSEIVSISTPNSRRNKINITRSHPIFTAEAQTERLVSGETIFHNLKNGTVNKNWKSIEELQKKYDKYTSRIPRFSFGLFPSLSKDEFKNSLKELDLSRFEYSLDVTEDSCRYFRQKGFTKRFIAVDYDLGKIIGLFLSEGNKNHKRVQFSLHRDENEIKDFIKGWAEKNSMRLNTVQREHSLCDVSLLNNKFLSSIIDIFVEGNSCYDKKIKDKIYLTNDEFVRGIIDGTWLGDGLHSPGKKNVLSLANKELIYQIKTLMSMFKLYPRLSDKAPQKEGHKQQWYLELNNVDGKTIDECTSNGVEDKKQQKTILFDGVWWGNAKIEPFEKTGEIKVFNIEVEEDNSYVAENLIVHNCNFNMSGDTVVDPKIIEAMKLKTKLPEYRTGWDRNYWIWENPVPGSSYLVSGDVARGDGFDFSTFHIFKLDTMEIVAEYQGKPKPEIFGEMLNTIGRSYGDAMMVVENASVGYATLAKLKELEYPNLYHSIKGTHEYISEREAEYRSGTVPGFTTSPKTRPLLIAKMEEFLRNNIVRCYSTRLVHELERFVWSDSGKPEAMRGSNDDLIMALAIGCWIRDTALQKSGKDIAYGKAMLNAIVQSNTKMSTAIPGMSGYRKDLDMDNVQMKEVKRQHQTYSWLYKG